MQEPWLYSGYVIDAGGNQVESFNIHCDLGYIPAAYDKMDTPQGILWIRGISYRLSARN